MCLTSLLYFTLQILDMYRYGYVANVAGNIDVKERFDVIIIHKRICHQCSCVEREGKSHTYI